MIVGVPKEVKDNEARVGVTPMGVKALAEAGHTVLAESGAGADQFDLSLPAATGQLGRA